MQKLRRIVIGVIWLSVFPLVVAAQTPEGRIDDAMARARAAGIPVSLLESKKAEGQAKGVPMDRIATAVETRLQHLEAAQDAMRRATNVDAAQLSVGGDAIGAGVRAAVLAEIANTATRERRSVAVAALTYLVSQGLSSEVALARVKQALTQGPQALSDLTKRGGGNGQQGVPGNGQQGVPATTGRGASGQSGAPGASGASGRPSSIPPAGQKTPPDPQSRGSDRGSSGGRGSSGTRGGPPANPGQQ